MAASSDPDTMTLEEALAAPDRNKFVLDMAKELKDHVDQKHWKVVPLKSIPSHKRVHSNGLFNETKKGSTWQYHQVESPPLCWWTPLH